MTDESLLSAAHSTGIRKALFLDRDGIINRRIVGGYVATPSEFELLDDILPILQLAHDNNYLLILISNQQGVGKGLMTREQLDTVQEHMQQVLRNRLGFALDQLKVCTSLASENDPRRKPSPGMLLEAIGENDVTISKSWFLGDSLTDAQAGKAAGVRTALVGDYPLDSADLVTTDLATMCGAIAHFLTES